VPEGHIIAHSDAQLLNLVADLTSPRRKPLRPVFPCILLLLQRRS
jgi:hypothetical protein